MDTVRVLHVDDDPALLDLARTVLERTDDAIAVETATSAAAALEALDRSVDCVVSDYDMPGTNGLELLAAVRERRPEIPFVLFTGKGSEEIASDAISAGVTDYLQKEGGTEQYAVLANRVRNAVERRRAQVAMEERLRAVEAASDGIAILDEHDRFTYVNDAHCELFGYDRETLYGEPWTTIYPDAEAERLAEVVVPAVEETGEWTGDAVGVRADGTRLRHELSIAESDGGYVGVAHEYDESAVALDESERRFQRLLENLPGMVYRCENEPGWPMEFVSDGCRELTGYDPETLESNAVVWGDEVIHPDDQDDLWPIVQSAVDRREPFRVDYRIVTADGETRWVWEQGSGVFEDDELVALEGFITDVTERRRVRERLQERTENLDSFVEVVTHDIRTPLQVARGELESTDGSDEHVRRAIDAIDRMADLVEEVAEGARGVDRTHDRVSLRSVAADGWRSVRTDEATLSVVDSAVIEADRDALVRLFENLFSNSVDHAGASVSIEVGTLDDAPGFYVADDGPGVPPEDRERVFEAGVTTTDDGTGYGLSNVARIAEAHGWTVEIVASDAGGARVEVGGVVERSMTEPV